MHTRDVVYLICLSIGVFCALVAFLVGNLYLPHVRLGHDGGVGHIGDVGHVGHVGDTVEDGVAQVWQDQSEVE